MTDTVLSIEDLFDVWNKLFNARTKWYAIGLNLNVDDETLRSIELQPSTDCGKCLSNMLAHRLRSGGPLTWKDLCNSLRSQTVGRSDVAEEIEKWLIKGKNSIILINIQWQRRVHPSCGSAKYSDSP